MGKKYYWLKLEENFFNQKEIKKLRRVAGGDTYTIIYLKLQLLSLKNGGLLIYDGIEDDVIEELGLEIDESYDDVNFVFLYLQKIGWIEQVEKDMFQLPQTIKNIASESQSAERVRKHREKTKLLCNANLLHSNTPVTNGNTDIDIDLYTDLDTDTEIEKNKAKPPEVIQSYFSNRELNDLFIDFLAMRKNAKAKNTDRAIKLLIKSVENYPDDLKIKTVELSIMNNWKGLFPENVARQAGNTLPKNLQNALSILHDEEVKEQGGTIFD